MTSIQAELREGDYGDKVLAVEPGGAELIPLSERHGKPLNLFWTWMSPNLEFATVFLGVLAVAVFGLSFWQAVLAIVVGTALGSLTHGLLSARGPAFGVPQMVLSRIPFGYLGNILPAGLNAVTASMGWFAVNSVSGAFALNALTGLPKVVSLIIVVAVQIAVAFFGHNMVHVFERYTFPVLAVIFLIASVIIVSKAEPGSAHGSGGIGGFLIAVGVSFGYAAGWNPYAADYSRYFPPDVSKSATALWSGLGVFVSCVILEIVGAASVTIPGKVSPNPTEAFTGHLPSVIANLTLLAIALGAVAANVINIYSGAMSFLAMGIRLPLALRRAIIALTAGTIGFALAVYGLNHFEAYEGFLLVIAYWVGPWLGVFFADWYLRRGNRIDGFLFDRKHNPWAGVVAMAIAMAVSIGLFANQVKYTGVVPKHYPKFGDIAFEVGFVLAAVLYLVFFTLQHGRKSEALVLPS